MFLFQLLAVLGRWDRAVAQLRVAAELDAANVPMAQTYREAVRAEVLRAEVFAGRRTPVVFGDPEEWMALLIQALALTAQGHHDQARGLRERAFDAAPATAGSVDGVPFTWISDGDTRLGPVLETVLNGRYTWVPFHQVRALRVEAPADLRDVVWTPAWLTLATGAETPVLLPTRYPGSEANENSQIRLARRTEWSEPAEGTALGLGQRVLTTDVGELPLMDLRQIDLDAAPGAG